MHDTSSTLWRAALAIAAAVLIAGCVPPPPPRPSVDSNTTGAEPRPAETEPSQPAPAPAGAAPETPAETTVMPPAKEEPKREPKPADEPAGAATATDEATKPETETTKKAETETPAKAEKAETEKPEKPAAETAPKEEMKPEDKPAEKEDKPAETKPAAEKQPAPTAPAEVSKPAAAAPAAAPAAAAPAESARAVTGDWPCWGGSVHRNMVNATTGITNDFSLIRKETPDAASGGIRVTYEPRSLEDNVSHILWTAKLGSQTYGNPVVSGGKVWVGTNNGGEYRPKHKGDRGCVLCFDEKTGKFLWQLTREKLPQGQANDWPEQGICSTPFVEGDRLWVVTNRCELMCLDTEGFYDKENDGPVRDEPDHEPQDADIVWNLDMMKTLGVFPHNMAASSPVVYGDYVYALTSNGVDEESHRKIPAPQAPSFLAVNKKTGEVAWQSNAPADKILHGQWSSPSIGLVNGQVQVYFAGGDGWLYAFDAAKGEELWRFDLNPKDAKHEVGGRGTKNDVIATPVFIDNSVVLATGQDPEFGDGVGHLYRIAATKKGDVSPVTPDNKPNPNSAQIWHWGGVDTDGSLTGEKGNDCFRRTLSTVAIHQGLVFAPDLSGRIHCLDFQTGKRYGEVDLMAAIWGSPMVADGKVFVGDEDGILSIFAEEKDRFKMVPQAVVEKDGQVVTTIGQRASTIGGIEFPSSIYSTPTIANGVIFVTDRSQLYAISTQ